jgi:hypothetical protein
MTYRGSVRKKPTFTMQLHSVLDTEAWRALSANAKVVHGVLKCRYNGKNNGSLVLSAREAGEALNASANTGARALIELQEHGFVVVTEDSNFNRKVRLAREYRLTELRDDRPGHIAPPTSDFRNWSRSKNLEHGVTGDIRRGVHDIDRLKRAGSNG